MFFSSFCVGCWKNKCLFLTSSLHYIFQSHCVLFGCKLLKRPVLYALKISWHILLKGDNTSFSICCWFIIHKRFTTVVTTSSEQFKPFQMGWYLLSHNDELKYFLFFLQSEPPEHAGDLPQFVETKWQMFPKTCSGHVLVDFYFWKTVNISVHGSDFYAFNTADSFFFFQNLKSFLWQYV